MTRALPTRAELEQRMLCCRADLVDAEDRGDTESADLARACCDALLEEWMRIPAPRQP